MRAILTISVLLSSFALGNARMVEYFEFGEGCGVDSEISLHSKPLEISNQKGCAMVQFPATAEFEAGNKKENYRIADKIRAAYGGWREWSEWTTCSKTCGSGQKTRSRACDSEQPDLYCKGATTSVRYCLEVSCPVHGQWVEWNAWNSCESDCSLILETRSRSCTNPAPKHGGDLCPGLSLEQRNCTSQAVCPGSWSSWTSWSACDNPVSGDCGEGSRSRSRACDNPAPRNGGEPCGGSNQDILTCQITCEPPGTWNDWGPWSTCQSVACGPTPGQESRTRTCGALPGAKICPSEDPVEDNRVCPVDCRALAVTDHGLGDWADWEYCPNTFHVNQFNIKSKNWMGASGVKLVCNNAENNVITSHQDSGSTFPIEVINCSEPFTKIRTRWQPDGGVFVDDNGLTCFELFCPITGLWQTPSCDDADIRPLESLTTDCPNGQAVCGIQTRSFYSFADNMGISDVKVECCRLPPPT